MWVLFLLQNEFLHADVLVHGDDHCRGCDGDDGCGLLL
jgi:hypothetical protein